MTGMGGQEGGTWRMLMVPDRRLDKRVIHYDVDVLGRPQGSYPESFVPLSLFLAEICGVWSKCLMPVVVVVIE